MTVDELLYLGTQIKVMHPIHGKCRIMGVGSTITDKITGIQLSPDSSPSQWIEITDYENLTQVAWDWEHDPDGSERRHRGIE